MITLGLCLLCITSFFDLNDIPSTFLKSVFDLIALASSLIVNENGDFSGSVSGGCVESAVVRECVGIIKEKKPFKKIEFKISNESAWQVGLACGGEIVVYLEQIS